MSALSESRKPVKRTPRSQRQRVLTLPYGKRNYLLLLLGLIAILLGFFLLLKGDTVFCTFLFVLGWVVLIPVGLFLMPKRSEPAS